MLAKIAIFLHESQEAWFKADHLPPVGAFWSITLCDLERRLMVANSIDWYSVGEPYAGIDHSR